MIIIDVTNNVCTLDGDRKDTLRVYKAFKFRNPNAYYVRRFMPPGWDGKIDFIKESGKFQTGILPMVIDKCKELKIKVELDDHRESGLLDNVKMKKRVREIGLRPYQWDAVKSIVEHKVKDIVFPRGAIKAATNAGKTYISAGIHLQYNDYTIYLMNSRELFEDAVRDIPKIIGEEVGAIGLKKKGPIQWRPFMVCMVGTLKNLLKDPRVKVQLAKYRVLIVDECDLADTKTNKKVIENLYNTVVRVGMSGTVFQSKLVKDRQKNMNLEGFFGPMTYEITNRSLIDKGVSSEVQVKFVRGNTTPSKMKEYDGWMDEYDQLVVKNKKRNLKIYKRSLYHWNKGRRSQLIIAQRHEHIIKLYKIFKRKYAEDIKIEWVHHDRKDRKQISQDFLDGKIDILIGSMILKRGKNFKLMNYMMNAGAGKSPENIIQLLGRAFRGSEHYEDMHDLGYYLHKWTKKREKYYKEQKIEVLNKYSLLERKRND
jgi:superfamily II DNA or RNA helicase